jgi:hypothetical protein|nr:hypothetical protein [uncultured Psychroserpens sp.]
MGLITTFHLASGVHTEIQHPEKTSFIGRFGWGLQVDQQSTSHELTSNWFHIGVPYIQSDNSYGTGTLVRKLHLNLELNENARLAIIRLREGRNMRHEFRPNIVGRHVKQDFIIIPDGEANVHHWHGGFLERHPFLHQPLTIEIYIEFLTGTPAGSVTFLGGGLDVISWDNNHRI